MGHPNAYPPWRKAGGPRLDTSPRRKAPRSLAVRTIPIVLLLIVLGASRPAFAVMLTSASASSQAAEALGAANPIADSADSSWSSQAFTGANNTAWIAVEFAETIPLGAITLTPRFANAANAMKPHWGTRP